MFKRYPLCLTAEGRFSFLSEKVHSKSGVPHLNHICLLKCQAPSQKTPNSSVSTGGFFFLQNLKSALPCFIALRLSLFLALSRRTESLTLPRYRFPEIIQPIFPPLGLNSAFFIRLFWFSFPPIHFFCFSGVFWYSFLVTNFEPNSCHTFKNAC